MSVQTSKYQNWSDYDLLLSLWDMANVDCNVLPGWDLTFTEDVLKIHHDFINETYPEGCEPQEDVLSDKMRAQAIRIVGYGT